MKTKMFEVVDRATCLVVVATKMTPEYKNDDYDEYEREYNLLRKMGFSDFKTNPLVLMYSVDHKKGYYTPYEWNSRTMTTAHKYIQDNFDELEQDDVIDVEYVLGETQEIKKSQVW